MDLALNIIKIFSIIASALFGALGLLTEYKDSAGKVTRWGRIALGGVLLSALVSFITQALEGSLATKAAVKARAAADAQTRTLGDLVKTAHDTAGQQQANLAQTERIREETLKISRATSANLTASQELAKNMVTSLGETRHIRTKADELLVSTQPLTTLSLHWQFSSTDPALWKVIHDGEARIQENVESVQGGVPRTPFDIESYADTLLPLMSYMARLGPPLRGDRTVPDEGSSGGKSSFVALLPLDDSQNAILSFGQVGSEVSWYGNAEPSRLSAGFGASQGAKPTRSGNSVPEVSAGLSATPAGNSRYAVDWTLDPTTLVQSIDRMNVAVPSTTKIPRKLRIVIFYDIRTLPFSEGNFATTYAVNLWSDYSANEERIDIKAVRGFALALTVDGMKLPLYKLTGIFRREVTDTYDDEIGTRCTIFEFERS